MMCPNCHAGNLDDEVNCVRCGADLTVPSTSLIALNDRLPAVLHNPQIVRIGAGVGAVAVGVGIELLRRGLVARMVKSSRAVSSATPLLNGLQDVLFPQPDKKKMKLPKGYEVHETVVYMRRVIRRD